MKMSQRNQNSSTTIISSYPPESQRRHTQLLMQFNQEMFKRNVLTDVECVVEGQVFQAHRALLVCFSPYLKKKLLSDDGKPTANKVYIPKIESKEFEILLQYMYSGNLEVDCTNIFEVYKAASLLEMQAAKQECLEIIDGRDEIKTYFYAYVLSKKLGVENNWQKALQLITHRFEETVFTKEFMQLDLQYVLEILSAQNLGARSETIVFLAALNWLNQDYERRACHAIPVMECVRFSCMSMEEIIACFHPPFLPEVIQIREVLLMLFRATAYIAAISQGKEDWFKQYANPRRILTVEGLPMKLWHTESCTQVDPHRVRSNTLPKYPAESWIPDALKSHIQAMYDSEEPESKHIAQSMEALFRKYPHYTDKEESFTRIPAVQEVPSFRDRGFFDISKDKESDKEQVILDRRDYPDQTRMDFDKNLIKTKETLPIVTRRKEYDTLRKTATKSKSICDASREIQYVIPEDTRVIHLVKGPLKSKDKILDDNCRKPQDFVEKFPEKIKMHVDAGFVRKETKKPIDLKVDHILPTKYHPSQEFEKSEVDKEVSAKGELLSDETIKERGCILIIGGMNPKGFRKDSGRYVRIFNVHENKLMPFIKLPEPRHNHCSACLGNTLYVVGGCNSEESVTKGAYNPKQSCFEVNLDKPRWSKIPNMIYARYDHALVVYKGHLIVIGGEDENKRILKSIEEYDPKQNSWTLLNTSMCCGRKAMGVAVYDDHIWVVGGIIPSSGSSEKQVISHVDIYHPEEEKWYFNSYLLPTPRSHCCLAEWNGKLYCIGGMIQDNNGKQRVTSEVWFVEGENQLWQQGPLLPEPRMGGVMATYGENLYYLGGCDPENDSNIVNIIFLSPDAESWSVGPPMTSEIFGLSAVSYKFVQEKHG